MREKKGGEWNSLFSPLSITHPYMHTEKMARGALADHYILHLSRSSQVVKKTMHLLSSCIYILIMSVKWPHCFSRLQSPMTCVKSVTKMQWSRYWFFFLYQSQILVFSLPNSSTSCYLFLYAANLWHLSQTESTHLEIRCLEKAE